MCPSPPTPARLPFGCGAASQRSDAAPQRVGCAPPPCSSPPFGCVLRSKGVGEKDAFLCRGGKGGRRL